MQEKHSAINSAETPLIEISEISVADAVAYTYKDYHARIQRQVPESGSAPPVGNPDLNHHHSLLQLKTTFSEYFQTSESAFMQFPGSKVFNIYCCTTSKIEFLISPRVL